MSTAHIPDRREVNLCVVADVDRTFGCVTGLALSALILVLFTLPDTAKQVFMGEIGPLELLTALMYLVAVVFGAMGARLAVGLSRFHFSLWTLLCFVFFGEETSWLQHYLGYRTPAGVEVVNNQGEFNFHNLKIWTSDKSLIAWLKEGGSFSIGLQHVFNAGFVSYFAGIPILHAISTRFRRLAGRYQVPVAGTGLMLAFLLPIAVTVGIHLGWYHDPILMEYRELLFAACICTFIVALYRDQSVGVFRRDRGDAA